MDDAWRVLQSPIVAPWLSSPSKGVGSVGDSESSTLGPHPGGAAALAVACARPCRRRPSIGCSPRLAGAIIRMGRKKARRLCLVVSCEKGDCGLFCVHLSRIRLRDVYQGYHG